MWVHEKEWKWKNDKQLASTGSSKTWKSFTNFITEQDKHMYERLTQ